MKVTFEGAPLWLFPFPSVLCRILSHSCWLYLRRRATPAEFTRTFLAPGFGPASVVICVSSRLACSHCRVDSRGSYEADPPYETHCIANLPYALNVNSEC
ncbi:hypothetical protein C8Q74DRAFT_435628 [Fomes fomentarius]|nr:hypothetical protein C8Q74DRAFT_435628 [Fomes fomentarius]